MNIRKSLIAKTNSVTEFRFNMAIHEAQSVGFLDEIPGIFSSSIMVGSNRDNFFSCKFPCNLLHFLLLRCEFCKMETV